MRDDPIVSIDGNQCHCTVTPTGHLTIAKFDGPNSITFHDGPGMDGALFTIAADGKITRGPAFTTEDEMSLMFWRKIDEAFPRFLNGE